MSVITVVGSGKLSGAFTLHGAKNSALPILAGTALCKGTCVIHNCPRLSDIDAAIRILRHLGAEVSRSGSDVIVSAENLNGYEIPDELMREMRSSIVFLGAVAARNKRAVLSSPGGCELGPRPIDLHLSSLKELGLEIEEEHGYLKCRCDNGLEGCEIALAFPSVGATENIMLAAATARGTTVIQNPAREPEISDLADFLNRAGANIQGAGSSVIEITGVESLGPAEHTVIPDRIEAATYLCAAAITGGSITLNNAVLAHLTPVLTVLKNAGCDITAKNRSVILNAPKRLNRIPVIRTMPYPGFPTDAGSPVMALLSVARGSSMFVENIFENRFKVVDELKRLGAKIHTNGRVAVIEGVDALSGAPVECTDLRGGAALIIAALAAKGVTEIHKTEHIERGYENICGNLKMLGANITLTPTQTN